MAKIRFLETNFDTTKGGNREKALFLIDFMHMECKCTRKDEVREGERRGEAFELYFRFKRLFAKFHLISPFSLLILMKHNSL